MPLNDEEKVVSPPKPAEETEEKTIPSEDTDPVSLVERWYENERFRKLYAAENRSLETLPGDFVTRVRALSADHSQEIFSVRASTREGMRGLLQHAGRCLQYAISASRAPESANSVDIRVSGASLPRVVDLLDHADYLIISSETSQGLGLGAHSPGARPLAFPALVGSVDWAVKKSVGVRTFVPPPGLMEVLAPHVFSWLEGKRATLMRFTSDYEVRFYRNSYEDGTKLPIVFHHFDILQAEVKRGAFAFVADATREYPDRIEIDTACMDIDPAPGTSYRTVRLRITDYLRFLREEVGVDLYLTHSGAKSYHIRIPVENAREDWGYVLPRATSWDTFARRRATEMPCVFVGEAMELVTRAYNQWTSLDPVTGREGRHDKHKRGSFFFDNRTGVRLGTRVPGSFHTSTGGIARNIPEDQIPMTFADLEAAVNVHAILAELEHGNESILAAPTITAQARAENTRQLLSFTRGFVEASAPWLRRDPRGDGGAE